MGFQDQAPRTTADRNCPTHHRRVTDMRQNIYLEPNDLEGLPPEVLEQLSSCNKPRKGEMLVWNAIGEDGASIDQILVRVWRSTKTVLKRNVVAGQIFRMKKAGLIEKMEPNGYRRCAGAALTGDQKL
jgi:hypothetical protein